MDKVFFFLLFGLFSISCGRSAIYPTSLPRALKPGDLVFQDLDCGDLCSAIEKVSTRKGFGPLSHVAMVEQAGPRGVVLIEALGEVRRVSFEVFARRSRASNGKAKIMVARLKKRHQPSIPFILNEVRARLGKPYDHDFLPDNGAYYCSELISDAVASLGLHLFPRHPISFGKPGSWARKVWEREFARRKRPLPQGVMGTNPVDLAASKYVKIIYSYN